MKPLSIRSRTVTIRNHLNEMAVAAQHLDLKRLESHRSIIEDHLYEIDKMMVELDCLADRIATR